jgi:hypothetical protein
MGKKLFMIIEVVLILIYLSLVLLGGKVTSLLDTSSISGLISIGVLTVVIFPIVLIMEKKREKMGGAVEATETPTGQPAQATSAQPVEPTQQAAPAQPVLQPQVAAPTQPEAAPEVQVQQPPQ